MPTQLACDQIVQRFQSMNSKVAGLIAAPLAMLMAADALSSKVTGYGAGKFDNVNQMLTTLGNLDTSVPGLISGLSELLECPAIQQSAQGTAIESMLDALDHGGTLDNAMLQAITDPIRGAFSNLKKSAMAGDPSASIGKIAASATSFLKDSGAVGLIDGLNSLAQCAAAVCGTAKSQELTQMTDDIRAQIRLNASGDVEPESAMAPETREVYDSNNAQVSALDDSFESIMASKFAGLV